MSAEEDASRLDRLLGEFVERLGRGEIIDPGVVAADRPDLLPQVLEVLELAKQVATVRPAQPDRDFLVITGFDIHGELGRGGMGAVYRARQRSLGRDVALKTILHPAHSSPSRKERFTREARAVARLQHENIVSILDIGEERGISWFAMELVEGRSLAHVLRTLRTRSSAVGVGGLRASDLAEAAGISDAPRNASYCEAMMRIAIDIARALEHAHAAGVIHRDVKPSNVLLRHDGHALLTDFGLAQIEGDAELTQSGEFLGTPFYVSPEQASGRRNEVGPATDVWSLGATLYEMLTLEPPFRGATTHEILEAVRLRDPLAVRRQQPNASRDLEVIVETALTKEPLRRYASVRALREDLERALRGEPIAAHPVGSITRILRLAKRHKAYSTAILSIVLLITVAPSVLLLQERRATRLLERQMQKVEASRQFQESILLAASPDRMGPQARIVDAIRASRDALPTTFPNDPELSVMLRATVAWSLESMGQSEDAYAVLSEGLAFAEQHLAPTVIERLAFENTLGSVELSLGRLDVAESRLRSVLERIDPDASATSALRVTAQMNLANVWGQIGKFADAEEILREAIGQRMAERGPGDQDVLQAQCNLGAILFVARRVDEAATLLREVIEGAQLYGHEAIELRATKYLASSLAMSGQVEPAAVLFRQAWTRAHKVFGEGSSSELVLRNDLGGISGLQGRHDESELWFASALRGREAISGIDHPETLITAANLAQRRSVSGCDSQVLALIADIFTRRGAALDRTMPSVIELIALEAMAYSRLEGFDAARESCSAAIESHERAGEESPRSLATIDGILTLGAGHGALAIERLSGHSTADQPGSGVHELRERIAALLGLPNQANETTPLARELVILDALLALDLESNGGEQWEQWARVSRWDALYRGRVEFASGRFEAAEKSLRPNLADTRLPLLRRGLFAAVLSRTLLALGRADEALALSSGWLADTECLEPRSTIVLDLRIAVARAALATFDLPRAEIEYGAILERFRFSCDPQMVQRALEIVEIEFGLGRDDVARDHATRIAAALEAAGWSTSARSYQQALELVRRGASR